MFLFQVYSSLLLPACLLANSFASAFSACPKEETCMRLIDCIPLMSFVKLIGMTDTEKRMVGERKCGEDRRTSELLRRFYVCCPGEGFVLPSNQTCGQTEAVNRIVGGTEAPLNAYPWMALLLYNDEGTQNTKLIPKCAGSLITNRFVLTAGHCLNLIGFNLISVRLGEHNIDTQPDCIKLMHGDIKCAAMHLEINIVGKARHVHDIALLKLEFPVRYTDEIRPICVLSSYPSSNPSFENQNFEIAGWGWTEKHEMSDVLLKANIVGRHPNDCSVLRLNNETEICAGGQKGRDTCSKDSGSPLMATMGRGADEFVYLAGITSYGFNACGSGPAVYLKTYKFYEWIRIRMFNL